MKNYKEYITGLSKKELQEIILGDENNPPKLTRHERTYSRVQILWAIVKLYREEGVTQKGPNDKVTFGESESFVDDIISTIERMRWYDFYNYDWIRFDIRKPGFYWFLGLTLFALFGVVNAWIAIYKMF